MVVLRQLGGTLPVCSSFGKVASDSLMRYFADMSTVKQLEEALRQLSSEERALFRAWYAEFDADEWDRQLEADVTAGRLDWLVEEARQIRRTR
jgi:hypothetical protein